MCALGNAKNRFLLEELRHHEVEVFEDTVGLIDAVRERGPGTAVVSASENCLDILRRAGLLDRFDVTVTGLDAAQLGLRGKPAPDSFLRAAELLGVARGDAVVFEDALAGGGPAGPTRHAWTFGAGVGGFTPGAVGGRRRAGGRWPGLDGRADGHGAWDLHDPRPPLGDVHP